MPNTQNWTPTYRPTRLFEWTTTGMMFGCAATILFFPETVERGSFKYISQLGWGPYKLVLAFLVSATFRSMALLANGRWPKAGPLFRAFGAGLGAIIWTILATALLMMAVKETGAPSVGLSIYGGLIVGELAAAYRAGMASTMYKQNVVTISPIGGK